MTRVGGLGETGDESARPLWRQEVEKRGVSLELWVAWLGEHKRGTALHSVTEGSGFPYPWIGITSSLALDSQGNSTSVR